VDTPSSGHPRWNQSSPATEALIMALVIQTLIFVSPVVFQLFEKFISRTYNCVSSVSSVRVLTEYRR